MVDAEHGRPPTAFRGVRMVPPQTARKPNPRHGLATFSASSRIREENSIILPEVDVQADLDAINQGEAYYDASTRQVWVNGRLYGMHEDGTTYPIHGEGIVQASRGVYNALKIIRRYNGVTERSENQITNEKGITVEDRALAIRIWRLRQEAQGK